MLHSALNFMQNSIGSVCSHIISSFELGYMLNLYIQITQKVVVCIYSCNIKIMEMQKCMQEQLLFPNRGIAAASHHANAL